MSSKIRIFNNILNFYNKWKFRDARRFLKNGDYDNASDIFYKLLKKNYKVILVLYNLIEIHEKLGTLDELLVIIDDLLLDERYDYNELLVQKGNILSIQGKDKIAMKCFDKVLQDDSTNLWAYYFKCYVLNKSGDLSNLISYFQWLDHNLQMDIIYGY